MKMRSNRLVIRSRENRLRRVRPSASALREAVARFEKTVTSTLETELASVTENARHLDNLGAPVRKLIGQDRRALASARALRRVTERTHKQRTDAIRKGVFPEPATAFDFTADPGWQMLAPPYDVSWRTGARVR